MIKLFIRLWPSPG